ncbi:hypothetical protein JCM33374_g6531 [Metschnikowia sp. JCM 33374]|nr:hypothetical protein JCM33374_g6531 [Metschnikowia sp. JCM 33374]
MANLDGISQFLKSDTHETSKATPLEILESLTPYTMSRRRVAVAHHGTETQGVISTDISQSSSGHGAEHRRRSDQVEQVASFSAKTPESRNACFSLLNSIAEDVKRPIPAAKKFDVGLICSIASCARMPSFSYIIEKGFANKTPEYLLLSVKAARCASSSLNRTANHGITPSAIRRRAP